MFLMSVCCKYCCCCCYFWCCFFVGCCCWCHKFSDQTRTYCSDTNQLYHPFLLQLQCMIGNQCCQFLAPPVKQNIILKFTADSQISISCIIRCKPTNIKDILTSHCIDSDYRFGILCENFYSMWIFIHYL